MDGKYGGVGLWGSMMGKYGGEVWWGSMEGEYGGLWGSMVWKYGGQKEKNADFILYGCYYPHQFRTDLRCLNPSEIGWQLKKKICVNSFFMKSLQKPICSLVILLNYSEIVLDFCWVLD